MDDMDNIDDTTPRVDIHGILDRDGIDEMRLNKIDDVDRTRHETDETNRIDDINGMADIYIYI